jgi:hypothetical protein
MNEAGALRLSSNASYLTPIGVCMVMTQLRSSPQSLVEPRLFFIAAIFPAMPADILYN